MSRRKCWMFLLAPLLYSLGVIFAQYSLGYVVSAVCVVVFVAGIISLWSKNRNRTYKFSSYIAIVFVLYALGSLFVSYSGSYEQIREMVLNQYVILPYLCIGIAAVRLDVKCLPILIKVLELSAIVFIVYSLANLWSLIEIEAVDAMHVMKDQNISFDNVCKRLGLGSGFLILLSPYLKKRTLVLGISAFAINLTLAVFFARRNIIFIDCLFFIWGLLMYIAFSRLSNFKKRLLNIVALCVVFVSAFYFISYIGHKTDGFFSLLSNRIDEDTRSDVTLAFYADMDDNIAQWVFGKGIFSEYYCPGPQDESYRTVIETGWQHIIFKLGIIGLLVILVLQYTVLRRKKTNILISACSAYIFISILTLLVSGVPTFDLGYMVLWMCVAIGNDSNFRTLSNNDIKTLICS